MFTLGVREGLDATLSVFGLTLIDSLESVDVSMLDGFILDINVTALDTVIQCRETYPNVPVVYIVDIPTSAHHALGHVHNIVVVSPVQVVTYLQSLRTQASEQPVVVFWGAVPQVGTTTLSLCFAEYLSANYDVSVGVLGLNLFDQGSWPVPSSTHFLDDLHSYLTSNTLTGNALKQYMTPLPSGSMYLLGNRNPALSLEYSLEQIKRLIDVARQTFDVVVCDAGSVLNSPGAVQSLLSGTQRYVIFTDRLYVQQRFTQQELHALKPLHLHAQDFLLLGNKMSNTNRRTLNDYAQSMNVLPFDSIGDMRARAAMAEQSQSPIEVFLQDKHLRTVMKRMAHAFVSQYGFHEVAVSK